MDIAADKQKPLPSEDGEHWFFGFSFERNTNPTHRGRCISSIHGSIRIWKRNCCESISEQAVTSDWINYADDLVVL